MLLKPRRAVVQFNSEFPPDDAIDRRGQLIPDGRALAFALQRRLAARGYHATKPARHRFFAWRLTVTLDDSIAWMLIENAEPWRLIVERRVTLGRLIVRLIKRRFGPTRAFPDFIDELDRTLHHHKRLSNVRWLSRGERRRRVKSKRPPHPRAPQRST